MKATKSTKALLVAAAALASALVPSTSASASSVSAQNFTFPFSYVAAGTQVNTVIDVVVQGYYNSASQLTEFSCTASSPTAVYSTVKCYQGKGVGNPITAGNAGSVVSTPPIVAAGATSSICFNTDFIYPGTGTRGRLPSDVCSAPMTLPV